MDASETICGTLITKHKCTWKILCDLILATVLYGFHVIALLMVFQM